MTKYFKEVEYKMDADFLAKLDKAREFAKVPFIINSAYRSPTSRVYKKSYIKSY